MVSSVSVPDAAQRPRHVAIIMDGNGRWARARNLPRLDGHRRGADVVRDITTFARELGIQHLTLFSFSVQNWRRPPEEVAGLMALLEEYCAKERKTLMDNEIRLHTIGDLSQFPEGPRRAVEALKEDTAYNRKMTLTLALGYGGREEIVAAVRSIARDARNHRLNPDNIDESTLDARLFTALLPDPDLVIRTSGEKRISNFLLWQIAYSELTFTDTLWPDFTRASFAEALWEYSRRERRFGATREQLAAPEGGSDEPYVLSSAADGARAKRDAGPC